MTETTNYSEIPSHEKMRAAGQLTVQLGILMLSISTVMKNLGHLPEQPISSIGGVNNQQDNDPRGIKPRGYFE